MLVLPAPVQKVLDRLTQNRFEGYLVGGCVRDTLCGLVPTDWDIATSATPLEMQRVFAGMQVAETGLKHGTLTVVVDRMPIEVTTYRVDGHYSDNRHPDEVTFTRLLREDLSRRDFTVNAMAYHPRTGLVDLFSGQADLAAKRLVCVGNPDVRFEEDALRILRAVRFCAVLGFSMEPTAAASALAHRALLKNIAGERIAAELKKLICGKNVLSALLSFPTVLTAILPELSPMVGFAQHSVYHCYDVYTHTAHAVAAVPPVPALRLAMLFHDAGKPACFTQDEDGAGHFYGHAQVSISLAKEALSRLHFDSGTTERVLTLVTHHDLRLEPVPRVVKRWLGRLGAEGFEQLLAVQRADLAAQNPELLFRTKTIDALARLAEEIVRTEACFSLKQLAVDGRDLMGVGILPGRKMGEVLEQLLDAVIEEQCPNEKAALLKKAKAITA